MTSSRGTGALLPKELIAKTSDIDHGDWNFRPLLGTIQRARFTLMTALLDGRVFPRLLELGYGSGIFMPELTRHCNELYGIDVHQGAAEVGCHLESAGVRARLLSARAEALPFSDGCFDGAVAISTIEFWADVDTACREIGRVLRPQGSLFVVTPGASRSLDLGLWFLTGQSARKDYGDRRRRVLSTLQRHFSTITQRTFPSGVLGLSRIQAYTALELTTLR